MTRFINYFLIVALIVAYSTTIFARAPHQNSRFNTLYQNYHKEMAATLKKAAAKYKEDAKKQEPKVAEALFRLSIACLEESKIHETFSEQSKSGNDLERFDKKSEEVDRLRELVKNLGYQGDDLDLSEVKAEASPLDYLSTEAGRIKRINELRAFSEKLKNDAPNQRSNVAEVLYTIITSCSEEMGFLSGMNGTHPYYQYFSYKRNLASLEERIESLKIKAIGLGYTFPE